MVSARHLHSLGIRSDGSLWAWGYNRAGQLGIGSTTDQLSPVQVGTATDWVTVSMGLYHNLGIRSDGSLWAWGRNNYGQLGIGGTKDRLVPTRVRFSVAMPWIPLLLLD